MSMDESPYSRKALDKHVESGYIIKCDNIEEAKGILNGVNPVISKGALISKEKDGVLKHRLILDCRVSGTNSATIIRENDCPSPNLGCYSRHHAP